MLGSNARKEILHIKYWRCQEVVAVISHCLISFGTVWHCLTLFDTVICYHGRMCHCSCHCFVAVAPAHLPGHSSHCSACQQEPGQGVAPSDFSCRFHHKSWVGLSFVNKTYITNSRSLVAPWYSIEYLRVAINVYKSLPSLADSKGRGGNVEQKNTDPSYHISSHLFSLCVASLLECLGHVLLCHTWSMQCGSERVFSITLVFLSSMSSKKLRRFCGEAWAQLSQHGRSGRWAK